LLLRAIPAGSKFNIVGFGDRFVKLFPESVEYNNENLEKATVHVDRLSADLGGTSILAPLQSILSEPTDVNLPRTVIVMTDGDVDRKDDVIKTIKRYREESRVFSLGISREVNKQIVMALANEGNGKYYIVEDAKNIESVTMELFSQVLQPTYCNISVNWPSGVTQVPYKIPSIHKNRRLLAFGMQEKGKGVEFNPEDIVITATNPENDEVNIPISKVRHVETSFLRKLAGWYAIRDLQNGSSKFHTTEYKNENPDYEEEVKKEIIRISVDYQVLSKYTSFIAEEIRDEETVNSNMALQDLEENQNYVNEPESKPQQVQQVSSESDDDDDDEYNPPKISIPQKRGGSIDDEDEEEKSPKKSIPQKSEVSPRSKSIKGKSFGSKSKNKEKVTLVKSSKPSNIKKEKKRKIQSKWFNQLLFRTDLGLVRRKCHRKERIKVRKMISKRLDRHEK